MRNAGRDSGFILSGRKRVCTVHTHTKHCEKARSRDSSCATRTGGRRALACQVQHSLSVFTGNRRASSPALRRILVAVWLATIGFIRHCILSDYRWGDNRWMNMMIVLCVCSVFCFFRSSVCIKCLSELTKIVSLCFSRIWLLCYDSLHLTHIQ